MVHRVDDRQELEAQGGCQMSDEMRTVIKLLAVVCVLFLIVCMLAQGCHMLSR